MSLSSTDNPSSKPRIVHFNHAGASPSSSLVMETVFQHMNLEQTMGGYTAAEMASNHLKTVYQQVCRLLNLNNADDDCRQEIALVESATVAWTRLFYSMAHFQNRRRSRTIILVSEAEYAANVVAACQWAKDHSNWTVLSIPSTLNSDGQSTGVVDLDILQQMLEGNYEYTPTPGSPTTVSFDPASIAMVCITHIPTNSGIVNNVEAIGQRIARYNLDNPQDDGMPSMLYLVDACQSVGQRPVDVNTIRCHGLVATGRKFLKGPRGTGFLYVPRNIANQLMPHHVDHFGVPVLEVPTNPNNAVPVEEILAIEPKEGAARFEFYESNVANKLGFGKAIEIALQKGIDNIRSAGLALSQDLHQRLDAMDHVQVHHPPQCGIVTFFVPKVPSAVIKQRLWDDDRIRFETSLVPATSTPLDSSKTRVPDMVRVSLSYTNSVEEVNHLCNKLQSILHELC